MIDDKSAKRLESNGKGLAPGNYYGRLRVAVVDERWYVELENYDGHHYWGPISPELAAQMQLELSMTTEADFAPTLHSDQNAKRATPERTARCAEANDRT